VRLISGPLTGSGGRGAVGLAEPLPGRRGESTVAQWTPELVSLAAGYTPLRAVVVVPSRGYWGLDLRPRADDQSERESSVEKNGYQALIAHLCISVVTGTTDAHSDGKASSRRAT